MQHTYRQTESTYGWTCFMGFGDQSTAVNPFAQQMAPSSWSYSGVEAGFGSNLPDPWQPYHWNTSSVTDDSHRSLHWCEDAGDSILNAAAIAGNIAVLRRQLPVWDKVFSRSKCWRYCNSYKQCEPKRLLWVQEIRNGSNTFHAITGNVIIAAALPVTLLMRL
jgi:hypothetical protein